MPPYVTNLSPDTETEAVNLMLRQIGELKVEDATTSDLPEVQMALDILKETTKEVESEGWKFNTEFGLRINPASGSPFAWLESDETTTKQINVFLPPEGLLDFKITKSTSQQSPVELDLVLRKSKQFKVADEFVQVFYDRAYNRDGLDTGYTFLRIDPVWYVDFLDLPQQARRYITVKAARVFCANVPGDGKPMQFTELDESDALRKLVRAYGMKERYNMFKNAANAAKLGYPYRRPGPAGIRDIRGN